MADTPAQDRKLKLPRIQRGKRFYTKYSPELALAIVERVADGETLKNICTLENEMPAATTFYKWARENKELRDAYQAAREISAFIFEDEALDTARGATEKAHTNEQLRAKQILIDQLRWSAGKRNPQQFSDKGNAMLVVPVNIQTTLDLSEGDVKDAKENDIYELSMEPVVKDQHRPLMPKYDPKAPRKRILTPRIGMDDDFDRPAYSKEKEKKNKLDRDNWRKDHDVKEEDYRIKDNAKSV